MTLYRLLRRTARRTIHGIPWLRRRYYASIDHTEITEAKARQFRGDPWIAARTVRYMERGHKRLLRDIYAGSPRSDFKNAATAVDAVGLSNPSLLEVGSGDGTFAEVFSLLCVSRPRYRGVDFSATMVEHARRRYSGVRFEQADATRLPFGDRTFDIVFNGASLMHILDYKKVIAESARVANRACIFHNVPVFPTRSDAYVLKYAYGSASTEIIFNRPGLLGTFARHGLTLASSWQSMPYYTGQIGGDAQTETFLLKPQIASSLEEPRCRESL